MPLEIREKLNSYKTIITKIRRHLLCPTVFLPKTTTCSWCGPKINKRSKQKLAHNSASFAVYILLATRFWITGEKYLKRKKRK